MPYHPKRRLGQHFLKSDRIIDQIISVIGPQANDTIVEIGSGQGVLTLPLAQSGARVFAVEFDRDLVAALRGRLSEFSNVTIMNQDFLTFEPEKHHLTDFKLVGNLPYNISSPVLKWLINHWENVPKACFMVQKEVAQRVCAVPGTKDWSPSAIFTQLGYEADIRFDVPPDCFHPPPKVTSSVIELNRKHRIEVDDFQSFEAVVRASFRHRRKLLINNLVPDLVSDAETARTRLRQLNLPDNCRAEQLSIDDFLTLTAAIGGNTMR